MIAIDSSVAHDPGQRPALEFAMQGHHERGRTRRVLEADMGCRAGGRPPTQASQVRRSAAGRRQPAAARSRRQRQLASNDAHL
jgi:hypothetical protein